VGLVTAAMLGALTAALVALVVVAIFESYRVALSACQFFLRLLASSCPAGGSPTDPHPSKDGDAVDRPEVASPYGPQGKLFSRCGDLSSPLPARTQADLVSAARRLDHFSSAPRRRFGRPPIFQPTAEHPPPHPEGGADAQAGPLALALPLLGAIDPSPNFPAFGAGVELGFFIALFTISSLLVLNWIVKTMRSSK
jgi:hypothetical protein